MLIDDLTISNHHTKEVLGEDLNESYTSKQPMHNFDCGW